jgi:hypothetical protein
MNPRRDVRSTTARRSLIRHLPYRVILTFAYCCYYTGRVVGKTKAIWGRVRRASIRFFWERLPMINVRFLRTTGSRGCSAHKNPQPGGDACDA